MGGAGSTCVLHMVHVVLAGMPGRGAWAQGVALMHGPSPAAASGLTSAPHVPLPCAEFYHRQDFILDKKALDQLIG